MRRLFSGFSGGPARFRLGGKACLTSETPAFKRTEIDNTLGWNTIGAGVD